MLLKKLIEYLPISRRKYAETLEHILTILEGLVESDENHCQIEVGLIQAIQSNKMKKTAEVPKNNNRNDISYS